VEHFMRVFLWFSAFDDSVCHLPMIDPPDREVAVFSAARRLPVSQRAAYLDEACAGDAALRQRVVELVQAGEEAGAFLDTPAPGDERSPGAAVRPSSDAISRTTAVPAEKACDRIGRYKLLPQIGEGGCRVDIQLVISVHGEATRAESKLALA
jgi:serine/threonine-protein kinase